jgi:microcin C transport system permease protein
MHLSKEFKVKLKIFRRDRRAFYSFLFISALFLFTLPAELICNVRPLLIVVDDRPYFPILFSYSEKDFGGNLLSEPDYKSAHFLRLLTGENIKPASMDESETGESFGLGLDDFEDEENFITPPSEPESIENNRAKDFWMIWPLVPYDYKYIPTQSQSGRVVLVAPYATRSADGSSIIPSSIIDKHYLGTDDRGRDVLARLIYGFRISMIFGISLAVFGTLIGCLIGGVQGFFGGLIDLLGQRLTEIWGSIPRLYILIILSSFLVPSVLLLFVILNLTAWMGIAAYIRAEFLKIRNLEFVKAAKGMGVSNFKIMRRHILPNALTPVITFFPFEVTAGILALVSLDYLNLGVPSPAPSMGELLAQGKNNLHALWILLPTFTVLTAALTGLTFIGEGVRNAFDPRRNA